MYLEKCTIRNIKCFEDVSLDFRNSDGSIRQWNVLIGNNGTGKTTLLQAIAIALMGEKAASVLLPRPKGWVRGDSKQGRIEVHGVPHDEDIADNFDNSYPKQHHDSRIPFVVQYDILEQHSKRLPVETTIVERELSGHKQMSELVKFGGWFAAGYGPFRRFSGSTIEAHKIVEGGYRESRFITLFNEGAALTNCVGSAINSSGDVASEKAKWLERTLLLQDYHCVQWLMHKPVVKQNMFSDEDNHTKLLNTRIPLNEVQVMLNNYLLPQEIRLTGFSDTGPLFDTPYAHNVSLPDLSDGYRTLLVLTLDVLRHVFQEYWLNRETSIPSGDSIDTNLPYTDWLRSKPGIVLIDELDSHLHPTLQQDIAVRLKNFFPGMQFIIATHSPFIAQAADDQGLHILQRQGSSVRAIREDSSVRGWRVDQILTSHLFGLETTRSPEIAKLLEEYDDLLARRIVNTLTAEETARLATIENELREDLSAPGETLKQREQYQRIQEYITKTLKQEHS